MSTPDPLKILNIDKYAIPHSPEEIIRWAEYGMVPVLPSAGPVYVFVIASNHDDLWGFGDDYEMLLGQLQDLRAHHCSTQNGAHYVIRGIDDDLDLSRIVEGLGPYGQLFVVKSSSLKIDNKIFIDCSDRVINSLKHLLEDWRFRDRCYFFYSEPYSHSVYVDKIESGEFSQANQMQSA